MCHIDYLQHYGSPSVSFLPASKGKFPPEFPHHWERDKLINGIKLALHWTLHTRNKFRDKFILGSKGVDVLSSRCRVIRMKCQRIEVLTRWCKAPSLGPVAYHRVGTVHPRATVTFTVSSEGNFLPLAGCAFQ